MQSLQISPTKTLWKISHGFVSESNVTMSTTTTTTATTTLEAEQQPQNRSNGTSEFFEDVHFLGDAEGKIVIRSPPTFTNKFDERKYQKEHLAAAFRVFAKQGFDEGVAGHISLRDPIDPRKYISYHARKYRKILKYLSLTHEPKMTTIIVANSRANEF